MSELIGRWNYYFLRYGVGTIIGAGIAALFLGYLTSVCPFFSIPSVKNNDSQFELNGSAVSIYLFLGFAYCYIASAPGTVFHASRGLFWNQNVSQVRQSPRPSFWLLVSLALIVALALVMVAGCLHRGGNCQRHHFCFIIPVVFGVAILVFQWLLIVFTFTRFDRVRTFYFRLTERRAEGLVSEKTIIGLKADSSIEKSSIERKAKRNGVSEYVESFRDLREHGNAFEIIFLEIVLAATIFSLSYQSVFSAVLFIVLWILPSALCWIVGTLLEFNLLNPPNTTNNSSPS